MTWQQAKAEAQTAKENGEIVLIEKSAITYSYPELKMQLVIRRDGKMASEPQHADQ